MQLTAAVDGRSQEPRLQMLAILKLYRAREQSQEHVLRDVLGRALTHLRSCRCAGSRDGCHHCVLGVLPTMHLELASRRRSIEVLENLLETWATEKIDSLDDITVQAQPESVLEARFRRYLAAWAEAHGGRVTPVDTGDGYTSMRLTVPSADDTDLIGWMVRAQRRVRQQQRSGRLPLAQPLAKVNAEQARIAGRCQCHVKGKRERSERKLASCGQNLSLRPQGAPGRNGR